jgi:hypothetical protein
MKNIEQEELNTTKDQIRASWQITMALWCLALYLYVIEIMISVMSCFQSVQVVNGLSDEPTDFTTRQVSRLREVPDIICYQDDHLYYMLLIGVPGFLFYVLVIPLYTLA